MEIIRGGFRYTSEPTEEGCFTCDGCIFLGKQSECKEAPECEGLVFTKKEGVQKDGISN